MAPKKRSISLDYAMMEKLAKQYEHAATTYATINRELQQIANDLKEKSFRGNTGSSIQGLTIRLGLRITAAGVRSEFMADTIRAQVKTMRDQVDPGTAQKFKKTK